MKKIILLLFTFSILSCSKDDNPYDVNSNGNVYKIIGTGQNLYFEYDSLGRVLNSYYNRNLNYPTQYFYSNRRLDSVVTSNSTNPDSKITPNYNEDDRIYSIWIDNDFIEVFNEYDSNKNLIKVEQLDWVYKYTYDENGNRISTHSYYYKDPNSNELTPYEYRLYEYDNKVNPTYQLTKTPYDKIRFYNKNNVTKIISKTDTSYFDYIYNDYNLPVKKITVDKNGNVLGENKYYYESL